MWRSLFVFAGVLSSAALVFADLPRPESSAAYASSPARTPVRDARVATAAEIGRMPAVAVDLGSDPANPWPRFDAPAPGPARSIGSYSRGCLQGGAALSQHGRGYQVMRPSSRRFYGHPSLIAFVEQLGQQAELRGLGPVLVGDLSHARGGRATGGHSSHQTGLDADIWYWRPEQTSALTREARDTLAAPSVLDARGEGISEPWKRHVGALLRLAAEDPRVERVFVHPAIKRALCAAPGTERTWLRKLRPWHGHDEHFHVRLACPPSERGCKAQKPLPQGDGCEQLGWWFSAGARAARDAARLEYAEHVHAASRWPLACDKLL